MIPESAKSLLHSQALAHVSTIDPDGRPQVTCAWVGLEGDEIVLGQVPADGRPTAGLRHAYHGREDQRSGPLGLKRAHRSARRIAPHGAFRYGLAMLFLG